ncbi:hypothetical protein N656DRAFT_835974 [Canariomyces notabilis]|uniref:Aminoglycoside phosphotransferase domain-containing protein n=1 Tax=Canariomyces notabilis TaxID=2074819 RepID=A0AAN6YUC6_9PEZI|nr:hypothetical protein N656DRAFT_835974 [Canariomyces arenarius]
MTLYDEIAEADADEEHRAWIRKLIDARTEIVEFVDTRMNGEGAAAYKGFFKGGFNLSFHIDLGDGRTSVLIRFAMPGETVTPWRDEKVANEPRQLGPFIIMDFVEGTRLLRFLRQPFDDESEPVILNKDVDEATLDTIYEQIADYMLQMSRLSFSRIGAISRDTLEPGTWAVTGRPLTLHMNVLGTATGYPVDQFHTTPLDSARTYFELVARQHLLHLETQQNLAKDAADVQRRFVARHRFQQLIPKYCAAIDDAGPFRIFCDDMQPANMLIDPNTLRITLVLDFESTNSMPAQFAYDPPWWLLLRNPGIWIDEEGIDSFLARYVPRLEQFLQVLERVEEKSAVSPANGERLSARMRESWKSGRFWFNYASRQCLDIDAIYWAALHDPADGDGLSLLEPGTREELAPLVEKKMEQLSAYNAEYAARFPDGSSE